MNAADRERVKELLSKAVRLPAARRGAFIEEAAAHRPDVVLEALSLLPTLDDAGFLSRPTGGGLEGTLDAGREPAPTSTARIGRYKLLQRIGEGGFGTVYMAEQTEPVVRRVALKIIKPGMDTRQVIARFEAERQALAMMDHPNIARVFDAGATRAGRPYFVMEFVRGDPVTAYCDREQLSVSQRLALFRDICGAVQHAHQKGIIHRDLKPSNVLVTVADGRPLPKVIDFGIAKATAARLTDKTLFTEMQQLIGTPEYMSPEQAEISGVDIDTRSDVYSLGVMLYQLLTGETPFDSRRLRSSPLPEIQRIICDEDPPRPSVRLRSPSSSAASARSASKPASGAAAGVAVHAARLRRTEPNALTRALRSDLDWIVMKCLEKDRNRRYQSASDLSDEIDRYLSGQPISAAPPSAAYRARKFVRRHRGPVAAGLALLLAIVGGVALALAGYVMALRARDAAEWARGEATRERLKAVGALEQSRANEQKAVESAARAQREASKFEAVSSFLQGLLESVDPDEARGRRDVTVRETVDRSAAALDAGQLSVQPEVEAILRGTVGRLYWAFGDAQTASRHLERAVALAERGALSRSDLAILRNDLGHVVRDQGDLAAAERLYRQALDGAKAAGESRAAEVGAIYGSLGGVAMALGRLDEAEESYRLALECLSARRGADDRATLTTRCSHAVLLRMRGDPKGAERELREVSERVHAVFGSTDPLVVRVDTNLAVIVSALGNHTRAVPALQRALCAARSIYGDAHPFTVDRLLQLGDLQMRAENWNEASRAFAEATTLQAAWPTQDGAAIVRAGAGFAAAQELMGRPERAEEARRQLLDLALAGDSLSDQATAFANLGRNLLRQKRWAEAEASLRESFEYRRAVAANDPRRAWQVDVNAGMLGEALVGRALSRPEFAAAFLLEAEALIFDAARRLPSDPHLPPSPPGMPDRRRESLERAVRLCAAWKSIRNEATDAGRLAEWQRRLDEYDRAR